MNGLDLDYLRATSVSSRWGWLCLAVGALALVWVHRSASETEQRVQQLEARVGAARRAADVRGSVADVSGLVTEVRAAYGSYQRLNTPWSTLFAALEASQFPDVRLVGIEPDAVERTALISGEARDYVAILNYISTLEAKGGLLQVHLTGYEMKGKGNGYPFSFRIHSSWKTTPTRPEGVGRVSVKESR